MSHIPWSYREEQRLRKTLLAGAAGGLLAAFAMNQFQALVSAVSKHFAKPGAEGSGSKETPSEDEDATVKTAKTISRIIFHHQLTRDETKWAGPLVHYSLGTTLGVVYGFLGEKWPATTAGAGSVYGTGVWLVADEIAVPAFGLAQGPAETSISSHANALASHLVFGLVTGMTHRFLTGR